MLWPLLPFRGLVLPLRWNPSGKRFGNYPFPPKLNMFLWSCLSDKLPTNKNIHDRIPALDEKCAFCKEIESTCHLFFSCPHAVAIWYNSPLRLKSSLIMGNDIKVCWEVLTSPLKTRRDDSEAIQMASFLIWQIWKRRMPMFLRK